MRHYDDLQNFPVFWRDCGKKRIIVERGSVTQWHPECEFQP
jgi:hypothetical protein